MKIKGLNRRNHTIFKNMYNQRTRMMMSLRMDSLKEAVLKLAQSKIESKRHEYPRQNAKTICEEYFKRKSKRKNTQNVFL
jgi:hypothetical protein